MIISVPGVPILPRLYSFKGEPTRRLPVNKQVWFLDLKDVTRQPSQAINIVLARSVGRLWDPYDLIGLEDEDVSPLRLGKIVGDFINELLIAQICVRPNNRLSPPKSSTWINLELALQHLGRDSTHITMDNRTGRVHSYVKAIPKVINIDRLHRLH